MQIRYRFLLASSLLDQKSTDRHRLLSAKDVLVRGPAASHSPHLCTTRFVFSRHLRVGISPRVSILGECTASCRTTEEKFYTWATSHNDYGEKRNKCVITMLEEPNKSLHESHWTILKNGIETKGLRRKT